MKNSDSVLDTLNIHIPYLYVKVVNYSVYLALRKSDENKLRIIDFILFPIP